MTKYPKTPYMPFSPQVGKFVANPDDFVHKYLHISMKMDGSNACLTRDKVVARNGSHASHPSFAYLKQIHGEVWQRIPPKVQIFGEWLYAKHSIHYENLPCPFQCFQVLNERGIFLDVDAVRRAVIAINHPHIGTTQCLKMRYVTSAECLKCLTKDYKEYVDESIDEGLVIRNAEEFHIDDFHKNVAKMVRPNHVQTDDHWAFQPIIRNGLQKWQPST